MWRAKALIASKIPEKLKEKAFFPPPGPGISPVFVAARGRLAMVAAISYW